MEEIVLLRISIDELKNIFRSVIREELQQKEKKDKFLTIAEVCSLLSVSRSTVNSWIKKDIITPIRLGRRVFFSEKKLLHDLEEQRKSGKIDF